MGTLEFHNGIDIYNEVGANVVAVADGVVTEVRYSETYGNVLKYEVIDIKNNIEIMYAHLDKVYVSVGDRVLKNQTVAQNGNTGLVTGPHLHYTIVVDGETVDPINLVRLPVTDTVKNELLNRMD